MKDRREVEDLKATAFRNAPRVLASLGIREPLKGGYISMCNPKRKDARPSFTIFVKGGTISFKDHATEETGDVFGLVAYMRDVTHLPNRGFLEAKRFLEDLFGVRTMSPAERKREAEKARRVAREAANKAGRELARKIGRAQEIFYNAAPLAGSLAETYLRARGIEFDLLPCGPRGGERRPGSLRFLPAEEHVCEQRGHPDHGTRSTWPCMVACCVDPASGDVRAIHRTWLARDGRDKAPVVPPRKCWPAVGSLIIPIWKGETWLSVPQAIANGLRESVVLCEGIETALSAVLAAPQHRTWAVIALGNLQKITLPECIDSVMLARENDWVKPQAVAAFHAGKAALERQGRPVSEIRAFGGSDLNDTLRGE